jgi:hypothetical protein
MNTLVIDCGSCVVRGAACGDCVVQALLGEGDGTALNQQEVTAMAVLAGQGLVSPLRLSLPAEEMEPNRGYTTRLSA